MLGLIADIGATNARFALADEDGVSHERVLPCKDYPGIVEAVRAYLEQVQIPQAPSVASFAIAGPVQGDQFKMVNHDWAFSIEATRQELGLERFHLMNDFEAIALAIPCLGDADLFKVGEGAPVKGQPIGIVGPGTGLGVASLVWGGDRYIAVPGEGGHASAVAQTQREYDVFAYLYRKYHHVSVERVCSGKGLVNVYDALRAIDGREDLPARDAQEISRAALDKACPLCVEALDMMIGFLGNVSGNLALTLGAHGGIYLAGGIIGKLGLEWFAQSRYLEAFVSKGRYKDYLRAIPNYVVTHPYPAFVGLRDDLLRIG